MPLPIGDTIGILTDNLRIRRSVLPIPVESAIAWTKGLDLPRGGETVLYTGLMYQLIPYIEGLVAAEERLGASPLANFTSLGRRLNRVISLAGVLAHPSAEERAPYDDVLRNIARLLQAVGVRFGSLYEDDLYSGALLHDLGVDEAVAEQARRVAEVFRRYGVRHVITVDPHTTNMLRSVYPRILPDWDLEVRSYLEVLAEKRPKPQRPLGFRLTIHDSCVYARYEGVTEEPRSLLRDAGVDVVEPEFHGRQTWCCGGPAESLFPALAEANAAARVEQLKAVADSAVTMCPICLVNLRKGAHGTLRLDDISHYLCQAYGAEE
jgi:Fe-S oxidoreductase